MTNHSFGIDVEELIPGYRDYHPDQPRDEDGKWSGGGTSGGFSKPVGGGMKKPVGGGVKRPVGGGVTKPVSGGATKPVDGGMTKPVGGGIKRPVDGGVKKPVGGGFTKPVGGGITKSLAELEHHHVAEHVTNTLRSPQPRFARLHQLIHEVTRRGKQFHVDQGGSLALKDAGTGFSHDGASVNHLLHTSAQAYDHMHRSMQAGNINEVAHAGNIAASVHSELLKR